MEKLTFYLKNPAIFGIALLFKFGGWIPDKAYLRLMYFFKMRQMLNLRNPRKFNEKLQWLKLYDRKPEYTTMVDKIEAKKWVAKRIGEQYIIPTLGIWEKAEDIDFETLPEQFVLKTNHDSGGIVICKDKSKLDLRQARKILNKSLRKNYYLNGREWPYKNVPRRILAEKYIVDESGYELKDYKIFCFNGEPKFIQVDFDRFGETGHKRNLYSTDWKLLDFQYIYPSDESHDIKRPANLESMLRSAAVLAEGHPFLRVDFYSVNGELKFGETTFFPESGFGKLTPEEWDAKLGQLIQLIDNKSVERGGGD